MSLQVPVFEKKAVSFPWPRAGAPTSRTNAAPRRPDSASAALRCGFRGRGANAGRRACGWANGTKSRTGIIATTTIHRLRSCAPRRPSGSIGRQARTAWGSRALDCAAARDGEPGSFRGRDAKARRRACGRASGARSRREPPPLLRPIQARLCSRRGGEEAGCLGLQLGAQIYRRNLARLALLIRGMFRKTSQHRLTA
jgi:hypothetical protein